MFLATLALVLELVFNSVPVLFMRLSGHLAALSIPILYQPVPAARDHFGCLMWMPHAANTNTVMRLKLAVGGREETIRQCY